MNIDFLLFIEKYLNELNETNSSYSLYFLFTKTLKECFKWLDAVLT